MALPQTIPGPVAATASRRLALRKRGDLVASVQGIRGETVWAVKDPLALRYYHLREEEYWILEQLDGQVTLREMQDRFARRFSPRRLELPELQAFLGNLHQNGLIIAEGSGQGDELRRRAREARGRRWRQALANPLSIRFRGFDPERLLAWLSPVARWVSNPLALGGLTLLIVSAVLLVASHTEVLVSRLPERAAFFGPTNLLWLAIVLGLTKLLHELGHALTLKHFGGECHEMGLMLLVFTPSLYCNVSDAWMLPSKWQRAAVGAAGMGVELVLAAAATWLWWFSEPGLVSALCLDVMFVCSVSTLLLNGNPLLRYDGYYLLADVTETPNLAQQSKQELQSALGRVCLGIELPVEPGLTVGTRLALAAYAAASMGYRLMITFGALWLVYKTLQPQRLEGLGEVLAWGVAAGFLAAPWVGLGRILNNPYWRRQVQPRRAMISSLMLVAGAGVLLSIPWPYRVPAPLVVQPRDAARVYVAVSGKLIDGAAEGASVEVGETIARLENQDLEYEVTRLRGQRDQQRVRVEHLKGRQVQDQTAAAELPPAELLLADLEQRLMEKLVDVERLTLTAPIAGVVLPPRRRPLPQETGPLPYWTGTPLDPANRDCTLESGTLVCLVGDPERLEALLVIDQADVGFVAVGQAVEMQFDQSPGERLTGTIEELAQIDLETVPPELLAAGRMRADATTGAALRPASPSYQARVVIGAGHPPLVSGQAGRAKIKSAPMSLWRRLGRAVGRTFGLELPE